MELPSGRFVKALQGSLLTEAIATLAPFPSSSCSVVRKTDGSRLTVRPCRCGWTLVRCDECEKILLLKEQSRQSTLPNAFTKADFSSVENFVYGWSCPSTGSCQRHVKS